MEKTHGENGMSNRKPVLAVVEVIPVGGSCYRVLDDKLEYYYLDLAGIHCWRYQPDPKATILTQAVNSRVEITGPTMCACLQAVLSYTASATSAY